MELFTKLQRRFSRRPVPKHSQIIEPLSSSSQIKVVAQHSASTGDDIDQRLKTTSPWPPSAIKLTPSITETDFEVDDTSTRPPSALETTRPHAVLNVDDRHFGRAQSRNERASVGFFSHAQHLSLPDATMIDNSTVNNTINNTLLVTGQSVALDKLRLYIDRNAAVDSSAREPVPTCHPKTRLEIRQRLTALLHDVNKAWWMLWLFGAAGTGKSALGQSFASACEERGELGAAFFFSRPNGRNKYKTVIPTLAYQLSTRCPPYRSALIATIDHDHDIFFKKPPAQLKKLIIEPLLQVRSQITTTFLMLLDGVDECGENLVDAYVREMEQRELVTMIANTVRDYPGLPLFWLLCSRPEAHLRVTFTDANTVCGREELAIDAKCRAEVEVVLRDGFKKMVNDGRVVLPESEEWPSEDEFNIVERAVAGLHVFGAAILKDIEHSASPIRQLKYLIPFLKHVARTGYPGSIRVMDLFYTRILKDVPKDDLPVTLRIIGILITMPNPGKLSTHALCNFMRLHPNDFSSALRMVHSIINIPPPEKADKEALRLYHASLSDFLTDVSRSGKFYIDKQKVLIDLIKTCFSWFTSHYQHFHRTPARPLTYYTYVKHDHDPLPQAEFTWIPTAESHRAISNAICAYVEPRSFELFQALPDQRDEDLLSFVHGLDLRYISDPGRWGLEAFLNWVCKWDSPSGFIRTRPQDDSDWRLLTALEALLKEPPTPGQFPLDWWNTQVGFRVCQYIFLGRGLLSMIICFARSGTGTNYEFVVLSPELVADKDVIDYYEKLLHKITWYLDDQQSKGQKRHTL